MAVRMTAGKGGEFYVPYENRTGCESIVYFTRDLSAEGLEKIYKKEIPANYTPPTPEEIEAAAQQPQNKELVNHTDEEIVIARDTMELVQGLKK